MKRQELRDSVGKMLLKEGTRETQTATRGLAFVLWRQIRTIATVIRHMATNFGGSAGIVRNRSGQGRELKSHLGVRYYCPSHGTGREPTLGLSVVGQLYYVSRFTSCQTFQTDLGGLYS